MKLNYIGNNNYLNHLNHEHKKSIFWRIMPCYFQL